MKLMLFLIAFAVVAAAAIPTDTNESDDLEFNSKSVAIEGFGETLSPANPPKAKRRSLGQFLGSILERTPFKNWLPTRCSYHHHDHDHEDYDYEDHQDDHHHQQGHHYGHRRGHHDHRTEPTSASTPLQPTTIRDRSIPPTSRNVEDNLTMTAVPEITSSTTTPATTTSSSTARYNDPDNELTADIDLRFGKSR